ncbi:hypothetical protein RD110_18705 [Rhodoferax koreense]|uniref:Uncharacterized protein n=1 Tax=Rhodoferax koreensis TaxID=1842727 RepID=A0A1P8JZ20_9BURK|nr:hypothetical protein RD110_18705 [Rhodoferax koreense]
MFDSALRLTTPTSSPTLLELAHDAKVGFKDARVTVDNMRRAGVLVVVRTRVVSYRNRPVAEYCTPARLEVLGVKRCALRDAFASWATPIV